VSFSFDFQDTQENVFTFEDDDMLKISSLDRSNFLSKYIKKSRKKKEVVAQEKQTVLFVEQTKKEEEPKSSLSILKKAMFVF